MPLTLDSSLKPATGWKRVCALDDIPVLGSRVVRTRNHGDVALFLSKSLWMQAAEEA